MMSKKISILLCVACLCLMPLFAKSNKLSPLPLPTMEMINTDPAPCDYRCLKKLLDEELFFSFLARFDKSIKDNQLLSAFGTLMEQHGFGAAYADHNSDAQLKIALILPKKNVGRYSLSTINTILAYLTTQRNSFYFEVFDLAQEDLSTFNATLNTIQKRGFSGAIAISTTQAMHFIPQLNPKVPLFIASIHKDQIKNEKVSKKIIFGGIDYADQITALKKFTEPSAPFVLYNDDSATGRRIADDIKKQGFFIRLEQSFNTQSIATFNRDIRKRAHALRGSNLFLNTPINNTALILSQLTYSRIQPRAIFTTQLGFNHALFALTQPQDRLFLHISSVTGDSSKHMKEYGALLDVEVNYDWINYATALGTEYLYNELFGHERKWFNEKIKSNQVQYKVKVYRPKGSTFEVVE